MTTNNQNMELVEIELFLIKNNFIKYKADPNIHGVSSTYCRNIIETKNKIPLCSSNDIIPVFQIQPWKIYSDSNISYNAHMRGMLPNEQWITIELYSMYFSFLINNLDSIESCLINSWIGANISFKNENNPSFIQKQISKMNGIYNSIYCKLPFIN